MLIIREAQLKVFEDAAYGMFAETLVTKIRARHHREVEGLAPGVLERRVATGLERARGYGLKRKNDLTTFVTLMFELSPVFDLERPFRDFLRDESVPVDSRIRRMLSETTASDWNALRRRSRGQWPAGT